MDQNPQKWQPNLIPKTIQNPLSIDFTCTARDDNNSIVTITIPALDAKSYPTYLADHIGKHLVDAIINERDMGYVTPEQRAELAKEVFVD